MLLIIFVGAKDKKNGKKDGRGSDSNREDKSKARRTEMEAGNNNIVNASLQRQELAGGDKKTLLDKMLRCCSK